MEWAWVFYFRLNLSMMLWSSYSNLAQFNISSISTHKVQSIQSCNIHSGARQGRWSCNLHVNQYNNLFKVVNRKDDFLRRGMFGDISQWCFEKWVWVFLIIHDAPLILNSTSQLMNVAPNGIDIFMKTNDFQSLNGVSDFQSRVVGIILFSTHTKWKM